MPKPGRFPVSLKALPTLAETRLTDSRIFLTADVSKIMKGSNIKGTLNRRTYNYQRDGAMKRAANG